MLHGPAAKMGKDPAFAYKKRIGAIMFLIYAAIYSGFTAITVLNPKAMEAILPGGLNLAVVYGFGLIVVALVMALAYNAAYLKREKALSAEGGPK